MAPHVCRGLRKSPSGASKNRHVLKKGPWTTSEDMLLLGYVKKYGEGNWNAVQRNSGLMRCGKSCRLRWANHLRPNLKKGAFSPEEEKLIVELHAKLGNKWARMAAQLPGRTDNEIKNYWNTRVKRRLRAGLPIYPDDLAHQEHQQHLNSSPKPQFSSLLPPNPNPNSNSNSNSNPLSFYDIFTSPENQPNNTPYINHQFKLLRSNNGGLSLSLNPSTSLFSSSTLPQSPFLPIDALVQYNSLNYGDLLGLPSIQSPPQVTVTPAASSSDGADDYEVETVFERRCSNSGLLQDLILESRALGHTEKSEVTFVAAAGGDLHQEALDFGFGHENISNYGDNYDGSEAEAPGEGIDSMDDDLMNLLDNFPLSVPIPNWNGGDGSESPVLTNCTNNAMENQPDASEYNPIASSSGVANQDWNFGPCFRNNMPSIEVGNNALSRIEIWEDKRLKDYLV